MLGKLKDAATRYVLRPVDASTCVCGRLHCSAPPELLIAEFGRDEWKGLGVEREWKGKEREGKGEGEREMEFRVDLGRGMWMRKGNG